MILTYRKKPALKWRRGKTATKPTDLFQRAAEFVDEILRRTRPADIPVEQPTKIELVVNLITARALGLELPAALLAHADE